MRDQPRRVLVVDDDEVIRGFLTEALSDEGYEVQAAPDGKTALDLLRFWRPHLIVLDLMMPIMDGWSFRAEQLKLNLATRVPVVILSATHDLSTQAQTLDAAGVFAKPFDLDTLLDTIDRLAVASCA